MTRALKQPHARPTRVIASVDRERPASSCTPCRCGGRADVGVNQYGVTIEFCAERRPCGYSRTLYRVAPPAPQARPANEPPRCARPTCTKPTRRMHGSAHWTKYCGDACLSDARREAFVERMRRAA